MKRLEELGISPTPWSKNEAVLSDDIISEINDANGVSVAQTLTTDYKTVRANNNFIAAAPKLYDAAERYVRFHEESVVHGNRSAREILADAHKAFQDLQSALAEAAGESEVANV